WPWAMVRRLPALGSASRVHGILWDHRASAPPHKHPVRGIQFLRGWEVQGLFQYAYEQRLTRPTNQVREPWRWRLPTRAFQNRGLRYLLRYPEMRTDAAKLR